MLVDGDEVSRLTEFYSDEMAAQFSVNGSLDAATAQIATSTAEGLEASGTVWSAAGSSAGVADAASLFSLSNLGIGAAAVGVGVALDDDSSSSAPELGPTVTITGGSETAINSEVTFTITFDADVTEFDVDDVTVAGGTKGTFTAVSASEYTLVVTPDADSTALITVDVAAGVATSGGTQNLAADQATQSVDTVRPGVTISDDVDDPVTRGAVEFIIEFDEAISGFEISDVVVTGGTIRGGDFSEVAIVGRKYHIVVDPADASTADITVNVAADVVADAAGNNNTVAVEAVQGVDTLGPLPTITSAIEEGTGNVVFTFTFDEAPVGFTIDDVDVELDDSAVSGASKGVFAADSEDTKIFTLTYTPAADTAGTLTADVAAGAATDALLNPSRVAEQASADFNTVSMDTSVVVFDFVLGVSSSHSERTFVDDKDYEIYFVVDSDTDVLNITPTEAAASGATWGYWTGWYNLDRDDTIIVVGNDPGGIQDPSGGTGVVDFAEIEGGRMGLYVGGTEGNRVFEFYETLSINRDGANLWMDTPYTDTPEDSLMVSIDEMNLMGFTFQAVFSVGQKFLTTQGLV